MIRNESYINDTFDTKILSNAAITFGQNMRLRNSKLPCRLYDIDYSSRTEDSFRKWKHKRNKKLQRNQEFENCNFSNIYILYSYLVSQGYMATHMYGLRI